MYKIIFSIAMMITMQTRIFAAGNDEVSQQALQSFQREFTTATNVKWEQKGTLTKATFTLNGQILFAYYNRGGECTAVVRNIVSEQLPISLLSGLKNGYTGYWISDLFELAADDQSSYYVTIENADKKLVLRSSGLDKWEVYSRTRKLVE